MSVCVRQNFLVRAAQWPFFKKKSAKDLAEAGNEVGWTAPLSERHWWDLPQVVVQAPLNVVSKVGTGQIPEIVRSGRTLELLRSEKDFLSQQSRAALDAIVSGQALEKVEPRKLIDAIRSMKSRKAISGQIRAASDAVTEAVISEPLLEALRSGQAVDFRPIRKLRSLLETKVYPNGYKLRRPFVLAGTLAYGTFDYNYTWGLLGSAFERKKSGILRKLIQEDYRYHRIKEALDAGKISEAQAEQAVQAYNEAIKAYDSYFSNLEKQGKKSTPDEAVQIVMSDPVMSGAFQEIVPLLSGDYARDPRYRVAPGKPAKPGPADAGRIFKLEDRKLYLLSQVPDLFGQKADPSRWDPSQRKAYQQLIADASVKELVAMRLSGRISAQKMIYGIMMHVDLQIQEQQLRVLGAEMIDADQK